MAISVLLKSERHEILARSPRPYVPLVTWTDREEYPMLGHVDPYGNTIYNRGQMETLMVELDRLRTSLFSRNDDMFDSLEQVLRLCENGIRRPHRYLWFVGD